MLYYLFRMRLLPWVQSSVKVLGSGTRRLHFGGTHEFNKHFREPLKVVSLKGNCLKGRQFTPKQLINVYEKQTPPQVVSWHCQNSEEEREKIED